MDLNLSADQRALIRDGIESGRLQRPEDAFNEAMLLWEERERRRIEILLAVKSSEASLAKGVGQSISSREQTTRLTDAIKQRGVERLATENRQR